MSVFMLLVYIPCMFLISCHIYTASKRIRSQINGSYHPSPLTCVVVAIPRLLDIGALFYRCSDTNHCSRAHGYGNDLSIYPPLTREDRRLSKASRRIIHIQHHSLPDSETLA
ncbi:uncharacterized protein F4817DRAFT_348516 [Daldinia loculata]|uniref:uncharacterized protein n=1 Tax=Daldinia loculata TaxID=103429 RepID=UPI0020C3517D|nr:uncharacterized protein F4817DRAFT_348516 [Daldinia loculata]KAI1643863.1 hypothetical protein F4817DRAFT_348516 [Daldinia loculata]